MDEHGPSPQTTLVILLGASEWPDSSDFHGSAAFANVASDFLGYLLNPQQFGLPEENCLDLFNTEQGPEKIDRAIRHFLEQRTSALQQADKAPRDLLFYFVGHGGFAGRNSEYYLAVRCTSSKNPGVSGIRIESLATTLTDVARYLRRFIILDCCYAAAAFNWFQAEGPAHEAVRQTVDVFKEKAKTVGKGTSLLCSSGKKVASLLTPDGSYTMFSKALLHVLSTGNPKRQDRYYLSLREVTDLTEEVLDSLLAEKAPRPELHSPDQVDGDVADVPFFPNVAKAVPHVQLGNYRLVRLLGHGGFADVYLGEHLHLGTSAAIKRLHTALTGDDRAKFLAEARTIARLEHSHIVRVLDFGFEHETPFLVMNYAPGGTLRQLHPKGTRLPPATIVSYVKQMADALQYAHKNKIVHRDVKPENMLLGRGNEVLLSDFGIAVIAHSTHSQSPQEVSGTAPYMAPEQIQGKPSPASDQYALGVVVYEWLSGERPFQGSLTELYSQHLLAPPPSLRDKLPTLAPDIERIVMIALAKDPGQRFASVQAFARALEQACLPTPPPVPVALPTLPDDQLAPTVPEAFNRISRARPKTYLKLTISLSAVLGLALYAFSLFNLSPIVPVLGLILTIVSWGLGLAQTAWFQQWNWFVGVLVSSPIAGIFYGVFGQTRKPNSSKISPIVRIYSDKQNKVRKYLIIAIIAALIIDALGNGIYTSSAINNAIYNNTAPGMESTYVTLTHNNPTQYYSLINNNGDNKWEVRKGCTFTAGAYQVNDDLPYNGPPQLDINPCFLQNTTFDNFVFQVQMKILAGGSGGIIFRDNGGNGGGLFYYLKITPDGNYDLSFYLDRQGNSTYNVMNGSPQSLHTDLGQVNTIGIVARGSELDLFINGHFINSRSDSGSAKGMFALVAENSASTDSAVVVFSDVKIWML